MPVISRNGFNGFVHTQEQALASVAVGRLVKRHSSLRSNNKRSTNDIASRSTPPEQSANRKPRMRHSSESELDIPSRVMSVVKGNAGAQLQSSMEGISEHSDADSLDLQDDFDGWHVFFAKPNELPSFVVGTNEVPDLSMGAPKQNAPIITAAKCLAAIL
jgi:hypothetical protein